MILRSVRLILPIVALCMMVIAAPAQDSSLTSSDAERKLPAAPPAANPNPANTPAQAPSTDQAGGTVDSIDSLLQPPPLPKGKATLIGGIAVKIDRVRNLFLVRPFGGRAMKIYFDERSHIYRDGVETTQMGIRKGDRVYVDTMSDGPHVFAKNIRVETQAHAVEARGQVITYNPRDGRMDLRDQLTSQPIAVRITEETHIKHGDQAGSNADLLPGSLVAVTFVPGAADRGVAREITVVAQPGSAFMFTGKITHLDLRIGILAVDSRTDNKTYEIQFDPRSIRTYDLGVGVDVTVDAMFDGSKYLARSVTVNPAAKQE